MVRLVPMSEAEFQAYLEHAIADYAQAHLKAGDCDESDALTLAKADYEDLLPEGRSTKGQHLYTLYADGEAGAVGMLWFASRERRGKNSAYIYDFQVRPELRGKGYGKAALVVLDAMLLGMGIRRVSLNVFGWNLGAKALYERHGFTVSAIGMVKDLDGA
jgi:ribosomal protein S18 acetylase RimI-like enzyme